MKSLHLPVTGHDLLAVERFQDDTRHMVEFLVLEDCSLGNEGQYIRLFLSEGGYKNVLSAQRNGRVCIRKHMNIIEGHILPDKPKKRRVRK